MFPRSSTDAITLWVTTERVMVARGPVPVAQLAKELDLEKHVAEASGKPPPSWSLAIAGDVPRAEVAAVFEVLTRANADPGVGVPTKAEGTMLLATPEVGTPPEPRKPEVLAKLHTELMGADPIQKATTFSHQIEKVMPKCAAVVEAFSAVASATPDTRCAMLARGVSEGLAGCGCPEADEFLTLLYGLSVDTQKPDRLSMSLPVTLDPSAASRTGATWAEIVEGLDEATLGALWVAP